MLFREPEPPRLRLRWATSLRRPQQILNEEISLAAHIWPLFARRPHRLLSNRPGLGVLHPAPARIGGFGTLCRFQRQLVRTVTVPDQLPLKSAKGPEDANARRSG